MKALGNHLLKTRVRAVLVISALTALSIFVPPFSWFSYFISGVPMGLVTLRKGPMVGLQVAGGCYLLIFLPTLALNLQPGIPLAFMLFVWLPVILCAGILRATRSQGLTILSAGTIGVFLTGFINLALEDIQKWWQEWFEVWKQYAPSERALEQFEQAYQFTIPLLPAIIASGFVVSLIITLLLARWWQSMLFNPGGFREEFHALRMLRVMVFPTLGGLLALLLLPAPGIASTVIRDYVILMLVLYLFQGLSVIHGYLYTRVRSRIWLTGIYVLFVLVPHFVFLFVSCIGLVNACLGGKPVRPGDNNA